MKTLTIQQAADLGFVLEKTFVSANGTGRTCQTVQGWNASGKAPIFGFNWFRSRKQGLEEITKWFEIATTDEGKKIQNTGSKHLSRLARAFPEGDAVKAEVSRREAA